MIKGASRIIGNTISPLTSQLFKYRKRFFVYNETNYFVKNCHTFFGYYDKSPFSKNSQKLLAGVTKISNRPVKSGDILEIGYFSTKENSKKKFNKIGETTTWCWQQGCRLQWHPKNNDLIIYNTLVNDEPGSIIQNVSTKEIISKIAFPLYDVSASGNLGLSLNFERLGRIRPGYGYLMPFNKKTKPLLENDGIWLVDMRSKKRQLIVSLASLTKNLSKEVERPHVVNISFNRSEDAFLYLFCYFEMNKLKTILKSYSFKHKKSITICEGISHYSWIANDRIIAFVVREGYRIITITDASTTKIFHKKLCRDGHPIPTVVKNEIITDSYYSYITRVQPLYRFNINKSNVELLFEAFIPRGFTGETRCDFHPRVNANSTQVCIDNASGGYRKISVIPLGKE